MTRTGLSQIVLLTAILAAVVPVWSVNAPNPIEDTPLIDKVTVYEGTPSDGASDEEQQTSLTGAMPDKFQHATLDDTLQLSGWMEPGQSTQTADHTDQSSSEPKPDADTQALAPIAGHLPSKP